MAGVLSLLQRIAKLAAPAMDDYGYVKGTAERARANEILNGMGRMAPRTAEAIHPQELADAILAATKNQSGLYVMSPEQYLRAAEELKGGSQVTAQIGALRRMLAERDPNLRDLKTGAPYREHDPEEWLGFDFLPRLTFSSRLEDGMASVSGHEGRHRMNAIGQEYGFGTPMIVKGATWGDKPPDNVDWLLPQAGAEYPSKKPFPKRLKKGGLAQARK